MKRREFIVRLGVAAIGCLPTANAQQARLIGVLMNGNSNEPSLQANVTGPRLLFTADKVIE